MAIACIGEAMVELSSLDLAGGAARVAVAGDSYNTAVYLSRLGERVDYLTVLGQDALSSRMVARMEEEGIGTAMVGRHPTRLPGLYAIETDARGERSFAYWRDKSAARTMFAVPTGPRLSDIGRAGVLYLTGITLAILPPARRRRLTEALVARRAAGAMVVFDPNYRPRLWRSAAEALSAFRAMGPAASLVLPSLDDEQSLVPGVAEDGVIASWREAGAGEIVVKRGAAGPLIAAGAALLSPALPPAPRVTDTTGAGDSFNAGYLAARRAGLPPDRAALAGHRLASAVIAAPGAILPKAATPERAALFA